MDARGLCLSNKVCESFLQAFILYLLTLLGSICNR